MANPMRPQIVALARAYGIDLDARGASHRADRTIRDREPAFASTLPRWTHQVDDDWWVAINDTDEPWNITATPSGFDSIPIVVPADDAVTLRKGLVTTANRAALTQAISSAIARVAR